MKILLADDHELIRKGLKEVISALNADWQVTDVASLPAALVQLGLEPDIDLVLLDLYLPGSFGLDGLQVLQQRFPGIAVVIISSEEAPEIVSEAIRSGASGYIPKSTGNELMAKALDLVISGSVYIPPQALSGVGHAKLRIPDRTHSSVLEPMWSDGLNDAQQQIAKLIGQGLSNRDIAEQTGFALQTVKNQVSRILRVTKFKNRAALAASIGKN